MDVVIFGNGAHGKDIAATLPPDAELLGFYDEHPAKQSPHIEKALRSGRLNAEWLIGVNDPQTRRKIANRWVLPWYNRGCWMHPDCSVGPDVYVDDHSHINAHTFLTRVRIGKFVTVGPGAVIGGDVTIGDGCLIGMGALIRNLVTIGENAVIGMGAVVTKDVPANTTVVGNPARAIAPKSQSMASALMERYR